MTTVKQEAFREKSVSRRAASSRRKRGRPTSESLLRRYRRKSNVEVRDELIERHRGHVEAMAHHLAARLPRSVDVQDLVHAGIWGLMQAIEKFHPDRGAPFLPFMQPRVRGAMIDELRNMDFLPRLFRHRVRERDDALTNLRDRLFREPSDAELAHELGISEVRLRRLYAPIPQFQATGQRPDSDPSAGGREVDPDHMDSLPDDDLESPIEALNRQDLLAKIESSLAPIEWTVLRMHYLDGMSGKEVADELRLSASRICQIHLRVLSRLKSRLASGGS